MQRTTVTRLIAIMTASLIAGMPAIAQIPNASFENWTEGNPDDWFTSNIPTIVTPVTQVSDAHSGQWAAKGDVVDFSGSPFAPLMTTFYFPVSQRHGSLNGWYKFFPMGEDALSVIVGMTAGGESVGAGVLLLENMQDSYEEFIVEIFYIDARVPDSCFISIAMVNDTGRTTIGSSFTVDDLSLGVPTSVDDPTAVLPDRALLSQNYPNPFNPSTVISFDLPAGADVDLSVFNVLGEKVATLVSGFRNAGNQEVVFDATGLPGGVYIYRLQTENFSGSKKLVLLK